MIKAKPSYPFETIALAVAFTSRLEALIIETKRLAGLFQAKVVFIHVGKRTSNMDRLLSNLLLKHGFNDSNCSVTWQDGSPVETILSICKNNVVDLLILGALEKDNLMKYSMGSVSREISRRAKCSVLLITEPKIKPVPYQNIVVNAHDHSKSIHTINTALYFAKLEGVSEIHLVDEMDIPAIAMSAPGTDGNVEMKQVTSEVMQPEKTKLAVIMESLDKKNIEVKVKTVSGRNDYNISQFAQSTKADLLVVNSPDHHLTIFDRIFSHDLEYVLADLPCNVLIVHSRVF